MRHLRQDEKEDGALSHLLVFEFECVRIRRSQANDAILQPTAPSWFAFRMLQLIAVQ